MLLWLCRCNPSQQRARERKNPIRQGAKITINLLKHFAVCLGGFQLRRLNRAYGFIIWGYLFHILFFLSPESNVLRDVPSFQPWSLRCFHTYSLGGKIKEKRALEQTSAGHRGLISHCFEDGAALSLALDV